LYVFFFAFVLRFFVFVLRYRYRYRFKSDMDLRATWLRASADARETEPSAPAMQELIADGCVLGPLQIGVALHQSERFLTGLFQDGLIAGQLGHREVRQAALPGAEEFTRSAQLQVSLGDAEAVGGLLHGLQPLPGYLAPLCARAARHQQAIGLFCTPPYP